ncbi:MAPEG family protein [Psychrobacter sp. I-STPA6b]|uniref:MAPEG family protein n=1 Tax=Psychrobacter sp. I-STPA6b TaxID=2585718 RepID=UPI001D0C6C34|nr:MAPEG family protein [Psychrobacter sp. I-STPA6b]
MSGLFRIISDSASLAIWAMLTASLLPLGFAWLAKALAGFRLSDNAEPRVFLQQTTGMARRANAVQQNSYETLPVFLASVIIAMWFYVPQPIVNGLAWLYVIIRVLYGGAYIANLPTLRSILWVLSMACCMMLFYFSIYILN